MITTYITSSSRIRSLQKELMQAQSVLIGTSVLPFEAACLDTQTPNQHLEIQCYDILQSGSFNILRESIKSPSFVRSLIKFRIELKCYGIGLDALPKATMREQEILQALSLIEPLIPNLVCPKGTVYYQPSALTHAQAQFLKSTDAIPLSPKQLSPTHIEAFEALNFRQELEGAIQHILENNYNNAVLAVFNLETVAPFIESCFQRYGIDLPLQNRRFDMIKHQCLAYLNAFINPSTPTMIALIQSGALSLKYPDRLTQYIKHYKLNYEQLTEPFDYAQPSDSYLVKDILKLQNDIQADSQELTAFLNELQKHSLSTYFPYILTRLSTLHGQHLNPLMMHIQTVYPLINQHNLPIIIHQIKALSSRPKTSLSIRVVAVEAIPDDIDGPLYVLGLSSKAYPNLKSLTGVLDERYVSSITGYPSLEARNAYALNQKRELFSKSKHLILSFPHANYEGKSLESAYDAEIFLQEAGVKTKAWKINEKLDKARPNLQFSPDLAHSLYLKEDVIRGSISSFEAYITDPIQHFFKYGLRLEEPPTINLDARLFGTLNHSFFERSLNNKDTNLWDIYESYLPKNDNLLTIIKELNADILDFHLAIINKASQGSAFKPTHFEQRFKDEHLFEGIAISGIIDRIDSVDDRLMIVDYKSSNHNLSEPLILQGQQLQLLTYALVARVLFQAPIQGVFYYSLMKNTLKEPTYSYKKSKGMMPPKELTLDDLYKAHGYKGWFFMEPLQYFDEPDYYSGLMYRKKDDTFTIRGGTYDIELVKTYFTKLYHTIKQNILAGNLDISTIQLPVYQDFSFKRGDDNGNEV